jgi:uncharacterized protein (DUF1810 family)
MSGVRPRGESDRREAAEGEFDLQRFIDAQERDGCFERALGELRVGRKLTHWMWFVFPQVEGLGRSSTSRYYALSGLDEARAYLRHEVLGPRLLECVRVLAELDGVQAEEILGPLDALKLRSSMTLFLRADPGQPLFRAALDRYFAGRTDGATEALL